MENKTNINWYPGHMAKTKKEIQQELNLIDVVIEMVDARIPMSSQNPEFKELIQNKKRIVVLNKSDLSDEKQNKLWIKYYEKKGITAIAVDSKSGRGIQETIKAIENLMEEELKKLAEKGRTGRKIRAIVLGIPNVGKSSFINKMTKRNSLEVGNKPGVTKKQQWIRVNDKIELLDTPGVLWPKFQNDRIALNLAFTGTIKDEILDKLEIAYHLTEFLIYNYKEKLCERYKISENEIDEIMKDERPVNENIYEIMLLIGKRRGAIISGGNVDEEKTARLILDDFRTTAIGKITLEKVPDEI